MVSLSAVILCRYDEVFSEMFSKKSLRPSQSSCILHCYVDSKAFMNDVTSEESWKLNKMKK